MTPRLLVLLSVAFLAACASAPPGPPPIAGQLAALRLRLFIRVEEERLRLDAAAKPLAFDPELAAAAQAHSDDMAKKRSFDNGPGGNVAVNALLADPKFRGYVAENSAAQYFTPNAGFDPDSFAQSFLAIWLASPDHKSNITFAPFDRTGIGVAVNGNAVYAAEIFSTDLGLPEPPP
jgi:uncharacterized protein YkwD